MNREVTAKAIARSFVLMSYLLLVAFYSVGVANSS